MNQILTRFEFKKLDTNSWQKISEVSALEVLQDNFERITPKISDMLHGKEIETPYGFFRIRP